MASTDSCSDGSPPFAGRRARGNSALGRGLKLFTSTWPSKVNGSNFCSGAILLGTAVFDVTWNLKVWLKVLVACCEPKRLAGANTWTLAHYLLAFDKKSVLDPPCLSVELPWYGDLMSQCRYFSTVVVQRPLSIGAGVGCAITAWNYTSRTRIFALVLPATAPL